MMIISSVQSADSGLNGRTDMQELEKILEEIDQEVKEYMEIDFGDEYNAGIKDMAKMAKKIIRKHKNDGWISVEDERLWDILFEEACVEGEQARRIYNRLKKTFDGERSEMNGKL